MAESRAGGADRQLRMRAQEGAFFRRRGLRTGRTGDDRSAARAGTHFRPQRFQDRRDLAGVFAGRAIGNDAAQTGERFRAASFRMSPGFDHQKDTAGAERESAAGLAGPDGRILVLQIEVAELVENEEILSLAVVGGAHEGNVALAGSDPRESNTDSIDAGRFFAHERARRAGHAVDDGNVAGEKIGQLRQKQRRAQVAHQPFVEKAWGRVALGLGIQNAGIDHEIALAAARGDDHVGS